MNMERRSNSFKGWCADVGYIDLIVCFLVAAGFIAEVLFTAASWYDGAASVVRSEPESTLPPGRHEL